MKVALMRSESNRREAMHDAGEKAVRLSIKNVCREIVIEKDAFGKPYGYVPGNNSPVAISISHSFPFAFAVADISGNVALGADIERIRDFATTTWEAFLTPAEKKIIATAPAKQQAYLRTLCWSLKESVLKAFGVGLRMHPQHVDVSHALLEKGASNISIGIDSTMYRVRIWSSRIGKKFVATAIAIPTDNTYHGNINLDKASTVYGNPRHNNWNHVENAPCGARRTDR